MNATILDNKNGRASNSSKHFGGVKYNTNKMDKGKGELMALRNFGAIQNDTTIRPEEVKQYLLSVARLNPRKEKKQFHAVISCKGKEYDKHQLTDAAHDWIKKMGYGDNPYIIVFHNDTEHNHVHIVSARVNIETGETIPDSFENVRALKCMDQIMKEKYGVNRNLQRVDLSQYNVTTLAQFKLLYETAGFSTTEKEGILQIYKRGKLTESFETTEVVSRLQDNCEDQKRADQLKAIFSKYLVDFDSSLRAIHRNLAGDRKGKIIGYSSDFTDFIQKKLGLQFIFHFKGDKEPYGYTIIDRKAKAVFKGGGIMKLSELTKSPDHKVRLTNLQKKVLELDGFNTESRNHINILAKKFKIPAYRVPISERTLSDREKSYYKDLLSLYLKNNLLSSIGNLNMEIVKEAGKWYVLDVAARTILKADDVLSSDEIQELEMESRFEERTQPANLSVLNPLEGASSMMATISSESGDDPATRKKKKR